MVTCRAGFLSGSPTGAPSTSSWNAFTSLSAVSSASHFRHTWSQKSHTRHVPLPQLETQTRLALKQTTELKAVTRCLFPSLHPFPVRSLPSLSLSFFPPRSSPSNPVKEFGAALLAPQQQQGRTTFAAIRQIRSLGSNYTKNAFATELTAGNPEHWASYDLCAEANTASYPQRDWKVKLILKGVKLTAAVVCLHAALHRHLMTSFHFWGCKWLLATTHSATANACHFVIWILVSLLLFKLHITTVLQGLSSACDASFAQSYSTD